MKNLVLFILTLVLALGFAVALVVVQPTEAQAQGDTIYYVTESGTGVADGSSWIDATGDLQWALDQVESAGGGQVWVKSGTYTPGVARTDSFQMKNDVAIYGGFPVSGSPAWGDRDWENNDTKLSGDIGTLGDNADNCYHVIYNPEVSPWVDDTAIIDGFTITGGNADGSNPNDDGAGMYNGHSSPKVANCTFFENVASGYGGGMHNTLSWPKLTNCTFDTNSANYGGGIYNIDDSDPTLTDCTFTDNMASGYGGGYYGNDDSDSTLTTCTFINNASSTSGGGFYSYGSDPTLNTCTFEGNDTANGGGAYLHSSNGPVTGCTFTSNTASSSGGGLHIYSGNVTLTSCEFEDNQAGNGGGLYNYSANKVTDCTFISNDATNYGGGIHTTSGSTYTNCTYTSNTAVNRGGGLYNTSSSNTVVNSVFDGNFAQYGGGIYTTAASEIINNTLWNNSALALGGGLYIESANPTVANCVFWGSTPNDILDYNSCPNITYCDIEDGYIGIGNISGSPMFVNPGSENFHLQSISPCINSGNNASLPLDTADLDNDTITSEPLSQDYDGDDRIYDNTVDIGADESPYDTPDVTTMAATAITINTATLNGNLDDMGGMGTVDVGFVWGTSADGPYPFTTGTQTMSGTGSFSAPLAGLINGRTYYYQAFAIGNAIKYGDELSFTTTNIPGTIYVNAAAAGNNDGSSWVDAFTSFQSALGAASAGDNIWVASGTYTPGTNRFDSFQLKNDVEIYGGFSNSGSPAWGDRDWENNETVLSGDIGAPGDNTDNCFHVFYHPAGALLDNTAVLDGVTISGGNATGSCDPVDVLGGGMYNNDSSPTLNNCTFLSNAASSLGGGMYNIESWPQLNNCTFASNSANYGGGMYNTGDSDPTLTDCTFSSNTADNDGGGLYNDSGNCSPTLTGCTFFNNFAVGYGGGMRTYSATNTLTDCTFDSNQANHGGGFYSQYGGSTLNECVFIDNTATNNGGGFYCYSSSTVTDCTFTSNDANYGAGMYNSTTLKMIRCTFTENIASTDGGGFYNTSSSVTLINSTFDSNMAANFGGGLYNTSSCIIANNVFTTNNSQYGGGMYNTGSNPTLVNCTFWNNSVTGTGGGLYMTTSSPNIANCILWDDFPNEIVSVSSCPSITYCDVESGYAGVGNIDQNPMLTNPALGDFHLLPTSPCMNAGDSTALPADSADIDGDFNTSEALPLDFEGDLRVLGSTVDMGADEGTYNTPQVTTDAASSITTSSATLNGTLDALGAAANVELSFEWGPDSGIPYLYTTGTLTMSGTGSFNIPIAGLVDGNTYYYRAKAVGDGVDYGFEQNFTATSIAETIYINATAVGANDGSSWSNAYNDLQNALEIASAGDQLWVASGTYTPGTSRTDSFQLKDNVAVYGGFPNSGSPVWGDRDLQANVTILSGDIGALGDNSDNCYHVFYHPLGTYLTSTAILDGFTISDGNASDTCDAVNQLGGGMYNNDSSPTISNCILENNLATVNGGAIYNTESWPDLTDCWFINNSAQDGGGIYNHGDSDPTLAGCTFTNNSASSEGGGLYNASNSDPTLTRCTFTGNSATSSAGGMYDDNADTNLSNCTFTSNTAPNGGGIYHYSGNATLTDCTFTSNTATTGYGGGIRTQYGNATITDCTFTGNNANHGGGMYNYNSSILKNCTFTSNTASTNGGGLYNDNNNCRLIDCTLSSNTASNNGGGMYNSSTCIITSCTFEDNSASINGGGLYINDYNATLVNCIFWANELTTSGGGIFNYNADPVIANCTFWDNSVSDEGGAIYNQNSYPTITNCIFWEDSPEEIFNNSSIPVVTYSNVMGGYSGVGNISGTPMVINSAAGDFHLQMVSPCINVGNNSALPNDANDLDSDANTSEAIPFDFEGDPRISGGVVDMGADEAVFDAPDVITDAASAITTSSANLNGTINDMGGAATVEVCFEWGPSSGAPYPYETGTQTVSGTGSFSSPLSDFVDGKTYYYRARAIGDGIKYGDEVSFTTIAIPEIIYVNAIASGSNNGTSWENAFIDMQDALFAATTGDEIWVASGEYMPGTERANSFHMSNNVEIYGGFPNSGSPGWASRNWETNVTTFSGDIGVYGDNSDDCHHVFYHPAGSYLDSTAVLDGFTITKGNANGLAAVDQLGGGMYNDHSSPQITNCTFYSNLALDFGGGIYNYNDSDPVLTDCTISTNTASDDGGGIYNNSNSDITLTDCYIEFNTASDDGAGICNYDNSDSTITGCTFDNNFASGDGGGVFNNSNCNAAIEGCTFSNNTASGVGGGMYNYAASTLVTSTFEDNIANNGAGFYNYNSSTVVTDCTFTLNDAASNGGGIYNYGSSEYTDCTLTDNEANNGGGLYSSSGNARITDCTFTINTANNDGGGLYAGSALTVTNCIFNENVATSDGGGIYNSANSTTVNSVFSANAAQYGGGMYNSSNSPKIANCTFWDNSATSLGGGMYNNNANPTIVNTILWRSAPEEIYNNNSTPVVTYCDVWLASGTYAGTGNINGTPVFVNPAVGDFHLEVTSPCIDAGNTAALPPDTADLDNDANTSEPIPQDFEGHTRVVGAAVDIGADESLTGAPTVITEAASGITVSSGTLNGTLADMGSVSSVDVSFEWGPTSGEPYANETTPQSMSGTGSFDAGIGGLVNGKTYYYRAKATGGGFAYGAEMEFTTINIPEIIYVNSIASGSNNGTSWLNAYFNLQTALGAASSGDQIWIASGTYTPAPEGTAGTRSDSFEIKDDLPMYGGFPNTGSPPWANRDWIANPTILSGNIGTPSFSSDNCYHVISGSGVSTATIIDGFTVTDSNSNGSENAENVGGGMYLINSSPKINDCAITENSAEYGAGLYNDNSSPQLTNCIFDSNSAVALGIGGSSSASTQQGLSLMSDLSLDNVIAMGSLWSIGGGMMNEDSNPTITNCTFYNNSADFFGAIANSGISAPIVTNSILWANSGQQIGGGAEVVTFSDVQGGVAGTGNINSDPLFVDAASDDFHLQETSPCIDSGTNTAPIIPSLDFEGDKRSIDGDDNGSGITDMGVDEYLPAGAMIKIYVTLQGANRPSPQGWEVPLNIGFYEPGHSNDWLLDPGSAMYYFPGTATGEWINGGTKATVTVGPVNSGTYDITADSTTTLLNVKKNVGIW